MLLGLTNQAVKRAIGFLAGALTAQFGNHRIFELRRHIAELGIAIDATGT